MGCHEKYALSHSPNRFVFRTTFLHLGGPTKQFALHEKIPVRFNEGFIINHPTPSPRFIVSLLKLSCIFMRILYFYRTT